MVLVKPGTFAMGNPQWEAGFLYEGPVHNVTLTKSYYIGKFEVTQAQWTAIMDSNPSYDIGDDIAVHQVSYNRASAISVVKVFSSPYAVPASFVA